MPIDASKYKPDPKRLRRLMRATALPHNEVARRVGISSRMLRYYVSESDPRPAPYAVHIAIEALAKEST